jgi:MATE family multidrug resistance protein
MVFAALKNVLVAHGRTGVIFWLSVGIVIGNLGGSVLLVHGVGHWEGLGVSGAAWATVGVNVVAAAVLFTLTIRWRLICFAEGLWRSAAACSREIVSLGWAASAQQLLESLLFVAVLYLLGLYSSDWLAAGTLAFAVMELNYSASAALGEVLAARLATARGASDRSAIVRLLRLGAVMAGASAIVLALTVLVFPTAVVAIFSSSNTDEVAQTLMAGLLQWTAIFFLCDAWQIVFVHALRGLRRVVGPMLISSGCYWAVGLGGGLLLAEILGLGAVGVWAGFCLGLLCAALVLGMTVLSEVHKLASRRGESRPLRYLSRPGYNRLDD